MFWLQEAAHGAAEHAEETAEHAEEAVHHAPIIVQLVNEYFGEAALRFELKYTKPIWDKVHSGIRVWSLHGRERDSVVHGDVFHRVHFECGDHLDL
jgi:hypothetical protein